MVALAGRSGRGAAGGLGVAKGTVYVAALVAALVPPTGVARNTKTVNDAFGLGERNRSLAQASRVGCDESRKPGCAANLRRHV